MENILISGLTEEQVKKLHEWEIQHSRELGHEEGRAEGREEGRAEGREEGRAEGRGEKGFEDVYMSVAEGFCDTEKACEVFDVDINAYNKWKAKEMQTP